MCFGCRNREVGFHKGFWWMFLHPQPHSASLEHPLKGCKTKRMWLILSYGNKKNNAPPPRLRARACTHAHLFLFMSHILSVKVEHRLTTDWPHWATWKESRNNGHTLHERTTNLGCVCFACSCQMGGVWKGKDLKGCGTYFCLERFFCLGSRFWTLFMKLLLQSKVVHFNDPKICHTSYGQIFIPS